MPIVNGEEHYAYSSRAVEAEGTDTRLLGVEVTSITDRDGNPLVPLHPITHDPISPFTTSQVNGLTPDCLLPATGVWMDFGAKVLWVMSDDVPGLAAAAETAALRAEEAAVAAAAAHAETLLLTAGGSLVGRVEALEQAGPFVPAIPGFEPVGYGVATTANPPNEADRVVGEVFDVVDG